MKKVDFLKNLFDKFPQRETQYDYSLIPEEFSSWKYKVPIVCKEHGVFYQRADAHLKGQICKECHLKRTRLTTEMFVNNAKKCHGENKYNYDKTVYYGDNKLVTVTCPEHGDFTQYATNHVRGHGCPACVGLKRHTFHDFEKRAMELHKGKYKYIDEFTVRRHNKVAIICPDHGTFTQEVGKHLTGQGCPKCSASKIERKIYSLLDSFEVSYEPEFEIPLHPYRYDILISGCNILIELHGPQHYRPVSLFNGEEGFRKRIRLDSEKRKLATESDFHLIEIDLRPFEKGRYEDEDLYSYFIAEIKKHFPYWYKINGKVRAYRNLQETYDNLRIFKCNILKCRDEKDIQKVLDDEIAYMFPESSRVF